jgi:hypothetical protein
VAIAFPFAFDRNMPAARARRILRRLPPLNGRPIRIHRHAGLRDRHGPVHGGAFLRERRIAFDCRTREFARIFTHEVFHFVWLRLGNRWRRSYEELVRRELAAGARGELGWASEFRKRDLRGDDAGRRTRRWREYCCESFCDSAAWLYSGVRRHEEFTLASRHRARRGLWFAELTRVRHLSI